jgi:hypothetical protein
MILDTRVPAENKQVRPCSAVVDTYIGVIYCGGTLLNPSQNPWLKNKLQLEVTAGVVWCGGVLMNAKMNPQVVEQVAEAAAAKRAVAKAKSKVAAAEAAAEEAAAVEAARRWAKAAEVAAAVNVVTAVTAMGGGGPGAGGDTFRTRRHVIHHILHRSHVVETWTLVLCVSPGELYQRPGRCGWPRHPTHCKPSFHDLNSIL